MKITIVEETLVKAAVAADSEREGEAASAGRVPLVGADLLFSRCYITNFYFYRQDPELAAKLADDAEASRAFCDARETLLKDTLAKTLGGPYFAFAGRLQDKKGQDPRFFIDCTNDGVPFVAARGDCALPSSRAELEGLVAEHGPAMVQPLPVPKKFDALPPLFVQATMFPCGGLALGVTFHHSTMDGHAAILFANAWAAMARTGQLAGGISVDRSPLLAIRRKFESGLVPAPPTHAEPTHGSGRRSHTARDHNANGREESLEEPRGAPAAPAADVSADLAGAATTATATATTAPTAAATGAPDEWQRSGDKAGPDPVANSGAEAGAEGQLQRQQQRLRLEAETAHYCGRMFVLKHADEVAQGATDKFTGYDGTPIAAAPGGGPPPVYTVHRFHVAPAQLALLKRRCTAEALSAAAAAASSSSLASAATAAVPAQLLQQEQQEQRQHQAETREEEDEGTAAGGVGPVPAGFTAWQAGGPVAFLSANDCICALFWKAVSEAYGVTRGGAVDARGEFDGQAVLSCPHNYRTRTDPPLPLTYAGNAVYRRVFPLGPAPSRPIQPMNTPPPSPSGPLDPSSTSPSLSPSPSSSLSTPALQPPRSSPTPLSLSLSGPMLECCGRLSVLVSAGGCCGFERWL